MRLPCVVFIVLLAIVIETDIASATVYRRAFDWRLRGRRYGTTLSLDPYVSYWSAYVDLKKRKVLVFGSTETEQEMHFYRNLLRNSLLPRYVTFQATYYPLVNIGVQFFEGEKSRFRFLSSAYDKPYSFSVFLGEVAFFRDADRKKASTGDAIMGYVATFGSRKVSSNVEYNVDWVSLEWKMQGSNNVGPKRRSGRFSAGMIFYDKTVLQRGTGAPLNKRLFQNGLYLLASRDWANKEDHSFSLIENSSLNYGITIPIDGESSYSSIKDFFSSHRFIYGKKYPLNLTKTKTVVFELSLGGAWERFKVYDQQTRVYRFQEDFQVLISPNVAF